MRVAACSIRAVAAEEVSARGNTVIGRFVRKVAVVAARTGPVEEVFADGDLGRIMCEPAAGTEGAVTYDKLAESTRDACQQDQAEVVWSRCWQSL